MMLHAGETLVGDESDGEDPFAVSSSIIVITSLFFPVSPGIIFISHDFVFQSPLMIKEGTSCNAIFLQ